MSTVTELPNVPLEVAENIIDQLSEDVRSLRSCSLTCRGWLPRARYHLVASICVRSREDLYSICDYFRFHPCMATFVQNLSISPIGGEEAHSLLETIPVALLSRLPKLRSYGILGAYALTVRAISFHATTLIHIKTCLHVEELTLQLLRFRTTAELARLLIALPRLRRLDCSQLHFKDKYNDENTGGAVTGITRFRDKCKCLSDVSIESSNVRARHLITQMSTSALQFLRYDLDGDMVYSDTGEFLAAANDSDLLIYRVADGSLVTSIGVGGRALSCAWRGDGLDHVILSVLGYTANDPTSHSLVRMWVQLPGDPVHSASRPAAFSPPAQVVLNDSESVGFPQLSPSGRTVAGTSRSDQVCHIWRMVDRHQGKLPVLMRSNTP
ncbi:hypothetical protein C8T65DRAFT_698498 [Cerioporus squamosus]|nr:hypothetical protein C8T65DRAFT_698498 [Cerioporus squamosus]